MSDPNALHEAELMMQDIAKAWFKLGWNQGDIDRTVAEINV